MALQFKLAPSESYKCKVQVVFRGDYGKRETLEINASFRRLPHAELRALGDRLTDDEDADMDAKIIRENLVGWEPFKDFAGNEVPFSDEALDAVLSETAFRRAFVKTFLESLTDPEANNRKN